MTTCVSNLEDGTLVRYSKLCITIGAKEMPIIVKNRILKEMTEDLSSFGKDLEEIINAITIEINKCRHCKKKTRELRNLFSSQIKKGFCLLSGLYKDELEVFGELISTLQNIRNQSAETQLIRPLKQRLKYQGKTTNEIVSNMTELISLCRHCQEIYELFKARKTKVYNQRN